MLIRCSCNHATQIPGPEMISRPTCKRLLMQNIVYAARLHPACLGQKLAVLKVFSCGFQQLPLPGWPIPVPWNMIIASH